ncbi:hypothetical protein B0H14DRAFT_3447810 [Mycena olivaceomarginata]|nr:hypothetical protein B0H14DRAFT_3447810 [Mycena olivaceomarginata]
MGASPSLPTVDVLEDERTQYVLIDNDIVPDVITQRKLRAYAAQWRGRAAVRASDLLHPCAPSSLSSASAFAYAALPPTYWLHAAAPAPPRTLLARYPSTITPTGVYLRALTNGYAHAAAPKRFRWMPALRAGGEDGYGVCFGYVEVRAFVCGGGGGDGGEGEGRRQAKADGARGKDDGSREMEGDGEPRAHFGIFATRALRQGEEIVVAGNGGPPILPTPTQRHLIAQLANILHALGADAECACTGTSSAASTSPAPAAAAPAAPSVSLHVSPVKEKGSGSGSEQGQDERWCFRPSRYWGTGERDATPKRWSEGATPFHIDRVNPRLDTPRVHVGIDIDCAYLHLRLDIDGQAQAPCRPGRPTPEP